MGSAQSQSLRRWWRSVAHPTVSPALKTSAISVLKVMADIPGGLQCPNTGLGAADGEIGLCGVPALAEQDPDGDAHGEGERAPIGEAPAEASKECGQDGGHGVFPERWSSIRAARALTA